jgi:hypothetical protein
MLRTAIILCVAAHQASALGNGVARTPPLGWLSWQRYRCTTACNDSTSRNCFNERLIKDTADAMVAGGYLDAGYEYVALDDCWQAPYRVNGHVVPDPQRFPSGIDGLAKYVHGKGLKLGLYTAAGNQTCAMGHRSYKTGPLGLACDYGEIDKQPVRCPLAKQDLEDFASWGIDHLKVDGCGGFDNVRMNDSYAIIGQYLSESAAKRPGGAPIVYHPSNLGFRFPRQFRELSKIANQWRWFNDVDDNWASVSGIIEEIGAGQPTCTPGPLPTHCLKWAYGAEATACSQFCSESERFHDVPRPGGWHDPDMLLLGQTPCSAEDQKNGMHCNSLTHDEEKTQLAVWAMASAPLFMSNDLPNVPPASKALLLNRELLAINQDPLGRMCFRFLNESSTGTSGWRKELADGDVAVALVNKAAEPQRLSFSFMDAGFAADTHVALRDVFAGVDLGWKVGAFTSPPIPAHGTLLLRLSYSPFDKKEL